MGEDAVKDLVWFVLIILAIGALWYYGGGKDRSSEGDSPFFGDSQKSISQRIADSILPGGGTDTDKESVDSTGDSSKESPFEPAYKYEAKIYTGSAAKKTDLQKEYVEVRALSSNEKAIPFSLWSLEGKGGLDIKMGDGAYLPYTGQVNPQETIWLQPGDKAYIVTGQSPIGTSFRLNKCTGYFEQFQDFNPSLPKQCPDPYDEVLPTILNDDCLDFIEDYPKCQLQISTLPVWMKSSCQEYVMKKINYKTCVELHKSDADFYKPEWRIYLKRQQELWKEKRETIILKDENGKVVDWDSY
jgi:hypothetical protein